MDAGGARRHHRDRYFVIIYLNGGNDGINTVIPYDDGGNAPASASALRSHYERARRAGTGGLRIPGASMLVPDGTSGGPALVDAHTGCQLGFHPAFAGMKSLYDQGLVAVLQGCGYPRTAGSLSHDHAQNAWRNADPLNQLGLVSTGWIGRHLVDPASGGYGLTDTPAATMGNLIAPELRQTGTGVLSVRDTIGDYAFPYGPVTASTAAYDQLYQQLNARAELRGDPWTRVATAGTVTTNATQTFPQVHAAYEANRPAMSAAYEGIGYVSSRIREVAKIIYGKETGVIGGEPPRFFQLETNGFDTHADQGGAETTGTHYDILSDLALGCQAFFEDLETLGAGGTDVRNKVLVLVWSEFGRRVKQNDNGTDHGSQAPVFVIGGAVNGGIYGNYPDLQYALDFADQYGNTPYSQDPGNGFRSTDFRDVYGTVLKHWINMSEAQILDPTNLPLDAPTYDPLYWTQPNVDLGFL